MYVRIYASLKGFHGKKQLTAFSVRYTRNSCRFFFFFIDIWNLRKLDTDFCVSSPCCLITFCVRLSFLIKNTEFEVLSFRLSSRVALFFLTG